MRLPPTEEADGLNMTPIIDVVFLLLIFFLVATRFDQEEREISVRLPEIAKAQPLTMPPQAIVVNVTESGEYRIGGQTLSEAELAAHLHQLAVKNPGTQPVQLRVDDRVPFHFPARAIGICERERLPHTCSVIQERPDE